MAGQQVLWLALVASLAISSGTWSTGASSASAQPAGAGGAVASGLHAGQSDSSSPAASLNTGTAAPAHHPQQQQKQRSPPGAAHATHVQPGQPTPSPSDFRSGLSRFFHSIDVNNDGQIEAQEAMAYIGSSLEGSLSQQELSDTVQRMEANLDSADTDVTISVDEVESHLRSLLQGARVADWVKHGLGLPQYSQAFKDNGITALDFPMLVDDGGQMLQDDLGVASKLHQQQILRAMKRVMLGLGEVPSAPLGLACAPAPSQATLPAQARGSGAAACAAVALAWRRPVRAGHPPMHKYKLERQQAGSGQWVTAVATIDADETSVLDAGLERGARYAYRLAAWNSFGWSTWVHTDATCAPSPAPCPADSPASTSSGAHDAESAADTRPAGVQTTSSLHAYPPQQQRQGGLWSSTAGWAAAAVGTAGALALAAAAGRQTRRGGAPAGAQPPEPGAAVTQQPPLLNFADPDPAGAVPAGLRASASQGSLVGGDGGRTGLSAGGLVRALVHTDSQRSMASHASQANGSVPASERSSQPGSPVPSLRRLALHGADAPTAANGHHGLGYGHVRSFQDLAAASMEGPPPGVAASFGRGSQYTNGGSTASAAVADRPAAPPLLEEGMRDDVSVASWLQQSELRPAGPWAAPARGGGGGAAGVGGVPLLHSAGPALEDMPLEDLLPTADPSTAGRHKCAYPKCHRQFGRLRLADMRRALQRHYCGMCQNVYCHHHTAVSPHGAFGSCGLDSQCVCLKCFAALPREQQALLEKRNKLVKREPVRGDSARSAASSGGGAGASSSGRGTPAAAAAAAALQGAASREVATLASASAAAAGRLVAAAGVRRGPGSHTSEHDSQSLPGSTSLATTSLAASSVAADAARARWRQAGTVAAALSRFSMAGQQRRARAEAPGV